MLGFDNDPQTNAVYNFLCKVFGSPQDRLNGFGSPEWNQHIEQLNRHLIEGVQKTHDLLNDHILIAPVHAILQVLEELFL